MLLITGASGFVGRHLLNELVHLSPATIDFRRGILPVYRNSPIAGGIKLNLTDKEAVALAFNQYPISGVIHMAAESRTSLCQQSPDLAYTENVLATRNLLEACSARQNPWVLYVSTDMVFSGAEGNYRPEDQVGPVNIYGESKVEAESAVQAYNGPSCIVRPALIYGAAREGRGSSLSWTLDVLKSGQGSFFADEYRTPVWVSDLVRLILKLVEARHTGIVHAGGPDRISRWGFAHEVADIWNLPIRPAQQSLLSGTSDNAWRPRDLSLDSKSAAAFVEFTPLRTALRFIRSNADL